jgi:chromosome partitioning protein
MQNTEKWLGPLETTYDYFYDLNEEGLDELDRIREEITTEYGNGEARYLKTFSVSAAAELVGRSTEWIRQRSPDVARNSQGHGRWTLAEIDALRHEAGTSFKRPAGSEPFILALSKFKGGVGNTTNACHLVHGFAQKGLKVLAVDFEPQASLTQILGGVVPDLHLEEADLPIEALLDDPNLIATSGAIRGTYFHNVDLMPANSLMNSFEQRLLAQHFDANGSANTIPTNLRLKAVLDVIKSEYDVIIIDCPPNLGLMQINALIAADGIITSLKPELLDRASLVAYTAAMTGVVDQVDKEYSYFRLLISQYLPNGNNGHKKAEVAIRTLYGDAVLQSMMPLSRGIADASTALSTVYSLEKPAGSKQAFDNVVPKVDRFVDEVYEDLMIHWQREAVNNG